MPLSLSHCAEDRLYEWERDVLVEEVRHRVDEDEAGALPPQRNGQALRPELQIEALLIGMPRHAAKAFSEGLCVTVCAAWTHLVAAGDRVPSGVRPFNPAVVGHGR